MALESKLSGLNINSGAQQDGPGPFRLLDLPLEVRDKIYEEMLTRFQLPASLRRGPGLHETPTTIAYLEVKDHVSLAILRTNRQVHREARAAMARSCRFMHISARGAGAIRMNKAFVTKQIPIASSSRAKIEAFGACVLAFDVAGNATGKHDGLRLDYMVLARDMPKFCQGLRNWMGMDRGPHRFGKLTTHTLTLRNPFGDDEKEYPTAGLQEELLKPFLDNVRGLAKPVTVKGDQEVKVPSALAKKVRDTLKMSEFQGIDPSALLADWTRRKLDGTALFNANDGEGCSDTWALCVMEMMRCIDDAHFWPSASKDMAFIAGFGELLFVLHMNMALNTIRAQVAELAKPNPDMDLPGELANGALGALQQAMAVPDLLREKWKPSMQQIAKLFFRKARAHHLACQVDWDKGNKHDLQQAAQAIQLSERAWPKEAGSPPIDPMILREKAAIDAKLTRLRAIYLL